MEKKMKFTIGFRFRLGGSGGRVTRAILQRGETPKDSTGRKRLQGFWGSFYCVGFRFFFSGFRVQGM